MQFIQSLIYELVENVHIHGGHNSGNMEDEYTVG